MNMKWIDALLCRVKQPIILVYICLSYLVLMAPIIYLGKYTKPAADDFTYGAWVHQTWLETGSLLEVFKAALSQVESSYYSWQGTFSSIFMMALNPAVIDYRLYKLVPSIMITILTIACVALAYAIIGKLCKQTISYWLTVGLLLAIFTIEKMYTIPSGFFWYNSAVHYTFMHSCMILMVAFIIQLFLAKTKIKSLVFLIFASVFAVASGGSNYATSLMGGIILLSLIAWLGIYMPKKIVWMILPVISYGLALYYNISAPGNSVRQSSFEGMGGIDSIYHSFLAAFQYIPIWMDWFTVIMMILCIPLFWNILRKSTFNFQMPGIVLIYSFCVVATGFTSSYYSMGSEGISRTHNVIKLTFQILLLLNELYIIGYIKYQLEKRKKKIEMPISLTLYVVATFGMILTVVFAQNQAGTFTSWGAYYYLKSGEAAMHYNEYIEREAILNGDEKNIVLTPYQIQPWFTYISDISEDPNHWINQAMSSWYQKESIRLESD